MFYAKIVPFSLFMYTAQFHSCPQKVDLAFDQSLAWPEPTLTLFPFGNYRPHFLTYEEYCMSPIHIQCHMTKHV